MKIFNICLIILCFTSPFVFSQSTCASSQAFCANNTSGTTFPASINTSAEAGPDYGCLLTTPNPAWYYFQVSVGGNISIGISGTGGGDVDFICWGPFTSPNGNCGTSLTAGNTVDCSYSGSPTETCTINGALAGQYYTLLLTNFANTNQNINFNQVGGSGSTNCDLIAPVASATICAGSTATISTSTNLTNPTFLWNPGAFTTQTITVSPIVTTVYTVTVNGLNASSTPTSITNTGTVTINSIPVITLPSTITMCENVATVLTSSVSPAGTYSYSWSTGANTASISVNTSTIVSLTSTNTTSGCVSNVASCTVTALPSPTITTYPIYNFCSGSSAVVTPTVTGGAPTYNYSWSPVGLGTADTAIVSSSGVYTVQVTDQNLCSGSSQFTVTTNQSNTIIASPNSICAANSSTLSSSLLGADSYLWSDGSSNDTLIVNTPGVYSLTIAAGGCTVITTSTIIASPTPTVTIPNTVTICSGSTASLTSVSISPSATYSYTWSTGATTPTINATNSNSTITLIVTDMNTGCSSNTSNVCTVVVNSNPSPTVNAVFICGGSTATVTPSITGGMPAYSYAWSSGLGTASVATVSSAGVYSVQVTDQNLCRGSTQFTVSTTQPTVAINVNPATLCGSGTVTLTPTLLGATSYSWSDGSINDTLTVNSPGVYSLTVTVNSCSATASNTVIISPTPTVVIPSTLGMCSGASAIVTPTVSLPGAYTYTWSNGSNANTLTISTTTILTLQVTNTVTGCVSAVSNSCSIVTAVNPSVTMSALPVVFCNGFSATLTPMVNGGVPSYTYSWTPSALGTASTAVTSTQGIYSVLVTDANQCVGSATVATVKSSPSVSLFSPDQVICPGDCAEIFATGTSSFTPFAYSWSNGTPAVDSTLMCSSGTVTVTFTDSRGCVATNVISITDDVIPLASFTATPSSPVTTGQLIDFTSTSTISSGSITSTSWSFGDGNTAFGNSVNHSYAIAGNFPVVITVTGSGSGCSNSYTLTYVVDAIIEVPNVFTPNGDGANEFLKFKNLELLGNNNLTIFNRWGKKIFEKDNYKNDWNGAEYMEGTYFFVLSVPEASPTIYQGHFQIMR